MRNGGEGAVEAEPVPDALFGFGFSVVAEARPCGAAGGEAAAEADLAAGRKESTAYRASVAENDTVATTASPRSTLEVLEEWLLLLSAVPDVAPRGRCSGCLLAPVVVRLRLRSCFLLPLSAPPSTFTGVVAAVVAAAVAGAGTAPRL